MKAVTKTRIVVGIVTLAVLLAMALPGLSVLIKDGELGLNMEIGSESVFQVSGETPVYSLEANLDSSYTENAIKVEYDGNISSLNSDNSALAQMIIDYAAYKGQPITVKAVDPSGNPVMLDYVDESTEDEQVFVMSVTTSSIAAKTVKPNLTLCFEKDGFQTTTDSYLEVSGNVIDIHISIPRAMFVVSQMLGCDIVAHLDVEYIWIMNVTTTVDLGNVSNIESDIEISGGVETITIDLSGSSDADVYLEYLEEMSHADASINGIPLSVDVDPVSKTATISSDVGTGTLSDMIEGTLSDFDGCIIISYGDPAQEIRIDSEQTGDILALLSSMEVSA